MATVMLAALETDKNLIALNRRSVRPCPLSDDTPGNAGIVLMARRIRSQSSDGSVVGSGDNSRRRAPPPADAQTFLQRLDSNWHLSTLTMQQHRRAIAGGDLSSNDDKSGWPLPIECQVGTTWY